MLLLYSPSHILWCAYAGKNNKIEFIFDLHEDTAEGVAHEMMEDLSLSDKEARSIAAKIKQEIGRIAAHEAEAAAQAAAAGLPSSPQAPSSSGPHSPTQLTRGSQQEPPLPFHNPYGLGPAASAPVAVLQPLDTRGSGTDSVYSMPQASPSSSAPALAGGPGPLRVSASGFYAQPTYGHGAAPGPSRSGPSSQPSRSGYQTPDEGSMRRADKYLDMEDLRAAMMGAHHELAYEAQRDQHPQYN